MLKVIGACCILFSCVMFSCFKVSGIKRKYENAKQMQTALLMMKNEIAFSKTEIFETLLGIASALSGNVADFFGRLSDCLRQDERTDFGQAWEYVMEEYRDRPIFSSGIQNIMLGFSHQVGKMSKEIELENMNKTLKSLEDAIKKEEEQYKNNRKLIYTFGFLGGFSVLILFL